MNREILFRGKTKDGEWIYGYYEKETSTSLALQEYGITEINIHYIHTVINHLPFKVEVQGDTVGQYTGLRDSNGVKIFEGDIIKEGCNGLISDVVWDDEVGTYKLKGLGDYYIKDHLSWEVIGNVPDGVKTPADIPDFILTDEEED